MELFQNTERCGCVQVVARCAEDIIKAKGVKPTLSPNLNTLATVEALDVKRLLFIGVGCQVTDTASQQTLGLHLRIFTLLRQAVVLGVSRNHVSRGMRSAKSAQRDTW